MTPRKLLVTGACGTLGGAIHRFFSDRREGYEVHGLDRRQTPRRDTPAEWRPRFETGRFRKGDICRMKVLREAVAGMDTVIHMAAEPDPGAPWKTLLKDNVAGTYNVFEACREAGVKRVIFASSIRVSYGYLSLEPYKSILEERWGEVPMAIPRVTPEMPVWPVEPYGLSKIYGEALGRAYASRDGMSCIALRIGGIGRDGLPWSAREPNGSIWCSLRDFTHLIERCVRAPESVRFEVFYALSDNRYRWADIERAQEVVGYRPQDRAEEVRAALSCAT